MIAVFTMFPTEKNPHYSDPFSVPEAYSICRLLPECKEKFDWKIMDNIQAAMTRPSGPNKEPVWHAIGRRVKELFYPHLYPNLDDFVRALSSMPYTLLDLILDLAREGDPKAARYLQTQLSSPFTDLEKFIGENSPKEVPTSLIVTLADKTKKFQSPDSIVAFREELRRRFGLRPVSITYFDKGVKISIEDDEDLALYLRESRDRHLTVNYI